MIFTSRPVFTLHHVYDVIAPIYYRLVKYLPFSLKKFHFMHFYSSGSTKMETFSPVIYHMMRFSHEGLTLGAIIQLFFKIHRST